MNSEMEDIDLNYEKRRKRDYVPRAEEARYFALAYDPLPSINIRSDATVNAMREGAPWIVAQYDIGREEAKRDVIQEEKKPGDQGFNIDGKVIS